MAIPNPAKLQVNWASVSFGATPITRITSGGFNVGGNLIMFSGDTNIFNICAAIGVNTPSASFTSGDVGTIMGLSVGAQATLSATAKDALGNSGGDVVFSMANATVQDPNMTGSHASYMSTSVTFAGVSADGVTSPISFTRS